MINQEKKKEILMTDPTLNDKKKVKVSSVKVADPSVYLYLETDDGSDFDSTLDVKVEITDSQNNNYSSWIDIENTVATSELKMIIPFADTNFSSSSTFQVTVTINDNIDYEIITAQPASCTPVDRFAVSIINDMPIATSSNPQKTVIVSNLKVANSVVSFNLETDDGSSFDSKLKIFVEIEDSQNNTFQSKITTGGKVEVKRLNILIPFGGSNVSLPANFEATIKVRFLNPTGLSPYDTTPITLSDYCFTGDAFEVHPVSSS